MTTSATRRADPRSFTLLEMILVLVLIGLLAAVTYPALGGLGRQIGISSSNYELLWLLRQARWWSVNTGRICVVRLRPGPEGYQAEVNYRERGGLTELPLQAEWATLAEVPNIRRMVRIPPDRDMMLRGELAVRFRPWGVNEDYVIHLSGTGGQRPARIEIRRPNGLVWLVPAEEPGPFERQSLAAIEAYWQSYCREAASER